MQVKSGRQSLAKLDSAKKQQTCVVCMEMTSASDARLDCCDHVFHFDCIKRWVIDSESKCPLCKKEVKTIAHKNEAGAEAVFEVESRH